MIQAMKYLVVAIVSGTIFFIGGYRSGCLDEYSRVWNQANQAASARYDAQKRQDDRVAKIVAHTGRRHAIYQEGFNACQEQF